MQTVPHTSNRLLQYLPPAELLSLCPHLESVEMAKGAVLTRAGAPIQQVYLPHSGVVSMMVGLSEGQTVEVAMIGRDSLVGASAALDDGPSLTDAVVVVPGTASVLKAVDFRTAAERSGTGAGKITRGFGHGRFAAFIRIEVNIAAVAIDGHSDEFLSGELRDFRLQFFRKQRQ